MRPMSSLGARLREFWKPSPLRLQELLHAPTFAHEFDHLCQEMNACHVVVVGAHHRCGTTSVATRLAFTLARRAEEAVRLTEASLRVAAAQQLAPPPPALLAVDPDVAPGEVPQRVPMVPPRHPLLEPSGTRGQVLLAEGNLRKPTLAAELGINGDIGLNQWDQIGRLPTIQAAGLSHLSVMVAGERPDAFDSFGLSTRLTAAADRARAQFDYVVWDSPPLDAYPDALSLASRSDGVLVVVEMDETELDDLYFMREHLDNSRIRVIGSVLNRAGRYWPRNPAHRRAGQASWSAAGPAVT